MKGRRPGSGCWGGPEKLPEVWTPLCASSLDPDLVTGGVFLSGSREGPPSCNRRTDAEADTPKLWPLDAKNRLIGNDPDAGRLKQEEKGMTQDEIVGWHHCLNGHEFEQTPGVGGGQGSLACCSP